jgi:hypothetical protein
MPNWCNNSLVLTHENPEMIAKAVAAAEAGNLCETFVPCPQELTETAAGGYSNAETQADLEAIRRANIEKYGYPSWYEWSIDNWGTKWEPDIRVVTREDANNASFAFDSAWAPPVGFYQKLEELGFIVKAYWFEPGMNFCGKWEDGASENYDIQGDSNWVSENIPRDIDEAMAISESMEQWEDEEEVDD